MDRPWPPPPNVTMAECGRARRRGPEWYAEFKSGLGPAGRPIRVLLDSSGDHRCSASGGGFWREGGRSSCSKQ
eukprot:1161624-Pelagomonas_calceolata.AAC.1